MPMEIQKHQNVARLNNLMGCDIALSQIIGSTKAIQIPYINIFIVRDIKGKLSNNM